MSRVCFGLTCAVLSLALVGCSQGPNVDVAKVTGKVTYKDAPLAGATVQFFNDDRSIVVSGLTNDQGVYELSGFVGGANVQGGPVGHCAVTVSKNPSVAAAPAASGEAEANPDPGAAYAKMMLNEDGTPKSMESEIPVKYGNPDESGLEFMIESGKDNVFDITLTD